MKILQGKEKEHAMKFMQAVIEQAKNATCTRAKGGSVIVKKGKIIGTGYNSPPAELETQRKCSCDKSTLHRKITDKTCCIHAEQRAILDALRKHPIDLENSTIYFVNIDENGKIVPAGKPYCTICSKMALDCGVKEFVLFHGDGVCVYNTEEYNKLSYKYSE